MASPTPQSLLLPHPSSTALTSTTPLSSARPPLPPPHAPQPTALRRLLRLGRQQDITRALSRWRLVLAHILRHQSLLRLQQQTQQQSQQLAKLRSSLPAASATPLRPGRPMAANPTAPAQGSTLLRDALLLRLMRHHRLLGLSGAFGRWLLMLTGRAAGDYTAVIRRATAPIALKRASAQEAYIAQLKDKLVAAEAYAASKGKSLTLVQRQLATATDRRRVAEGAGKHATNELKTLQLDAGRARAQDAELAALRDAAAALLGDMQRLKCESAVLAAELHTEERSGAHARELVVSCHAALLRAQEEQNRSAEQLSATWRKGLGRSASQQSVMAADLRSLAALFGRCAAQKKALAATKRRAHEEGERRRLDSVREGWSGGGSTSAMSSHRIRILAAHGVCGSAPSSRASSGRDDFGGGGGLRTLPMLHDDDEGDDEAAQEAEVANLAAATTAAAAAVAAHEADEAAAATAAGPAAVSPPDRETLFRRMETAVSTQAAMGAAGAVSPAEAAASARATSFGASPAAVRQASLLRVLRSCLERCLKRAWTLWLVACLTVSARSAAQGVALALDESQREVERLKALLKTCRAKLAAEKEISSRRQSQRVERSAPNVAVQQLGLQVQVLQRRLQQEQQARQTELRRREASTASASRLAAVTGREQSPARVALASALAAEQQLQMLEPYLGLMAPPSVPPFKPPLPPSRSWPPSSRGSSCTPSFAREVTSSARERLAVTPFESSSSTPLDSALEPRGDDCYSSLNDAMGIALTSDMDLGSELVSAVPGTRGETRGEAYLYDEDGAAAFADVVAETRDEASYVEALGTALPNLITAPSVGHVESRHESDAPPALPHHTLTELDAFDWEDEYDQTDQLEATVIARPPTSPLHASAVAAVEAALSPPRPQTVAKQLNRWAVAPPPTEEATAPSDLAVNERILAARARAARVLAGL